MDPFFDATKALDPLAAVFAAAGSFLDQLDDLPVLDRTALPMLDQLDGALPDGGLGASAAVDQLIRVGTAAATQSSGPHFYHFVIGGATPAAMAADWLTSLLDQNAAMRA